MGQMLHPTSREINCSFYSQHRRDVVNGCSPIERRGKERESGYLVQQTTALLMFVRSSGWCLSRDTFKRPNYFLNGDVFEALLKIGRLHY